MLSSSRPFRRYLNLALAGALVLAGAGLVYTYKVNNRPAGTSDAVVLGQTENIPNRPAYVPAVKDETTASTLKQPKEVKGDYVVAIDAIGVKAPIIVNVDGLDENAYLKALEKGVAHYKGTPLPGHIGNAFIFGHSSYYANKPGQYKTIFKELGKVKKGDTFTITINNKDIYTYSVFTSTISGSEDTHWLDESKDEIVTLSTCWPPGTLEKRWVVQGKRVTDSTK